MRTVMWRSMLSAAMVVSLQSRVPAAEEKIKPGDLSTQVFDSVNARFPGLTFVSVAKETDPKGEVVYDIELKQRGRKFETDIKADGTMLEVEKEVMKKDWPKALRSTVEKKYPKGKVKEVLEVNKVTDKKEVPDHLEVTIETAGEKSAEMLLSLDGKKAVEESQVQTPPPAADVDIKLADLPQSLMDAVKAKFPNAKIKSAEKGTEEGKPIYEVSIDSEKRNVDVTFNPEGEILSYEKTLLPSERPKVMMQTLKSKYPDATIKLIEEVWDHGKRTGYEGTIVTDSKKTVEVDFDPQGKLIENDKKK